MQIAGGQEIFQESSLLFLIEGKTVLVNNFRISALFKPSPRPLELQISESAGCRVTVPENGKFSERTTSTGPGVCLEENGSDERK
jgi:hypothetical protein